MNIRQKILTISFFIMAIILIFFASIGLFKSGEQSREGELMINACEDIRQNQLLKAEQDIEMIMDVMLTHAHAVNNDADHLVASSILILRKLEEEVEFRNLDIEYYKGEFAKILNTLAYVELKNAKAFLEKEMQVRAQMSISNAKHYLHDALYFTADEQFKEEISLLHKVNRLNDEKIDKVDLNKCVEDALGLIS